MVTSSIYILPGTLSRERIIKYRNKAKYENRRIKGLLKPRGAYMRAYWKANGQRIKAERIARQIEKEKATKLI
jgi:hypothetical protein